ncbi:MAG: bifunctional folylpolyglutamate synthase/dihydrofolate synthase [Paludibacteraceae bacterium]|nr:bifunctional folylpolyglutamate synthase/dihydrofolate synthase [Paludibacteraceae bacterium]
MNYEETLHYLYNACPAFHQIGAGAYKPGLDNTWALMQYLNNPHMAFPAVHIAGTNGKGSVSHMIAASLQSMGLKVGLYTSPHLVDYRERIRINGQMISRDYVVQFVDKHKAFLENVKPSFFEITMALAFDYFACEKVDIAVIEVGLGGRLDATNVITPLLSVITNIGLDHTEFLGNTLAQIAGEKAGIIKPQVPCVIGETDVETMPVFMNKADECGLLGNGLETSDCRLYFADQCCYLAKERMRIAADCELKGIYQQKNCQTAFVALRALYPILVREGIVAQQVGFSEAVSKGFRQVNKLTGLRGRWEKLATEPTIICDTGHNSHGIKYVVEQLQNEKCSMPNAKLRMVFGMVNDKDVDVVLKLLPTDAVYYFTQAKTSRAIPAAELQSMASWLTGKAYLSVKEAVQSAQKDATQEDIIFIGGSNYVVGEALPFFPL